MLIDFREKGREGARRGNSNAIFYLSLTLINTWYCRSFILAILMGEEQCLIGVGISISLMTNDVEHLCTCLLAIGYLL